MTAKTRYTVTSASSMIPEWWVCDTTKKLSDRILAVCFTEKEATLVCDALNAASPVVSADCSKCGCALSCEFCNTDPTTYSEQMQHLGRRLAELLDEDRWNEIEPLLHALAAASRLSAPRELKND